MSRVIRLYVCARCGKEVRETELTNKQGPNPFVGVVGNRSYHIKCREMSGGWCPTINRSVFMCQDCWNALDSLYEKFVGEKVKGK